MILSKNDLSEYMQCDMGFYYEQNNRERLMYWLTNDPIFYIAKYIRYLRREEYYYNVRKDFFGKICYLYFFRKKNILGNYLGIKIPKNCVGAGLTIYHHGEIIVNETAVIGKNCRLHGGNCIGNNGILDRSPKIGDGLDLGVGAKIIGDIRLGNNIKVGANAVVTKNFLQNNVTLVGIPAREVRRDRSDFISKA